MKYISLAVAGCLLFPVARLSAQQNKDYDEKVLVTAPYQPSLGGLTRPVFRPELSDSALRMPQMEYDIFSRPLSTTYPVENIKAGKVLGEPIEKLRNNTLRLGIGWPLTPLAELNFAIGRNRKYDFAAFFRHHSTFPNVADADRFTLNDYTKFGVKANQNTNEAHVKGSILNDKFISVLDIGYAQNMVNCYGVSDDAYRAYRDYKDLYEKSPYYSKVDDDFIKADHAGRWYQTARATLNFKDNARKAEDWRFNAYAGYELNLTNWSRTQNEGNLVFGGDFLKQLLDTRKNVDVFSMGALLRFEDNMFRDGIDDGQNIPVAGSQGLDMEYKRGNRLLNAWHLQFGPKLHYVYDFVELNADLVFHVFGNDEGKESYYPVVKQQKGTVQFNPNVDLKLHIIPKVLTFFVGTDGGVERPTVSSLSALNPYLDQLYFSDFRFMREYNIYAGLNGSFSRNIDFRIAAETHFMRDVLSFDYYRIEFEKYPVTPLSCSEVYYGYNDFKPEYTDKAFYLKVRGDLNFRWDERILAHVDATYHYYNRTILYKPAFVGNISFRYNLAGNRLSLYTNLMIASPMQARERRVDAGADGNIRYTEVTLNRHGVYDWSIGAEYRFIKRMTAFLNLNNILAQKYYLWNDYQAYRFNFVAGVTFDF